MAAKFILHFVGDGASPTAQTTHGGHSRQLKSETLEYLLAAFLSSQPVDAEVLEKIRDEADKDLMAEKARCLPEVFEARELAKSLAGGELGAGASEEVESNELLAKALGGATVESQCFGEDCCNEQESKQLTWTTPEDGKTVKENLLGLCSGCHGNLHKGLLRITPQPDGTLIFTDSRGRRLDHQADLKLAGWLDQHQGWSGGEFDSHYARLHQGEWSVFS